MGQGGDHQPVPAGDDLVVQPGRNALASRGEERREAPPQQGTIVLGLGLQRLLESLDRAAVLEAPPGRGGEGDVSLPLAGKYRRGSLFCGHAGTQWDSGVDFGWSPG